MGAFHAYDIRGVWGKDWNLDIAYKVGYFIPILLKTNKVLVGRDCRTSSMEIHDAVIKGINDAGADVYESASVPPPWYTSVRPITASTPPCRLPPATTRPNTMA